MTAQEQDRLRCLQRVADGYRTQGEAAIELGISERHVRRLLRGLAKDGPAALISKRRGRSPNNRFPDSVRALVLERYNADYHGFGPTLLAQVLAQRDSLCINRETLRTLLLANGLWTAKRNRRKRHPMRERRTRFGELVQMDGSPHAWFEDRGPRATLLVAIDDATSCVTAARFETSETTNGYYRLLRMHFAKFGRFSAAYTDKHSIFRYSGPSTRESIETQLQRALTELDIELICANSPQAKGRVERANRTFQDRLIKIMRLESIATIDAANAFLPSYLEEHNASFASAPTSTQDAHRSISSFNLDRILCRREERTVTKDLTFQIDDTYFQLHDSYSRCNLARGSRVEFRLQPDGNLTVHHGDHLLQAMAVGRLPRHVPIVESKDLNVVLDRRTPDPKKVRTPAKNHLWRSSATPAASLKPDISALLRPDISALR